MLAFGILYLLPEDTAGASFAWPIAPRITSLMLGATYLEGAYFFFVVLFSRQWRYVRTVPPLLPLALAFSIILMLVAVYVARADIACEQPTSWLFVGGLSLILLLAALTYASPKRLY